MTPKEKADELINKYLTSRDANQWDDVRDVHAAIRCALIAIDEIIQGYEFDSLEINHKRIIDSINFWDEVKKEIEKL
jgi:hypothetical protein